MSRHIPIALKNHLTGPAKTVCYILKIIANNGEVFAMTTLDRNVNFGGVEYSASSGFDISKTVSDTSFSVNNGEAKILFSGNLPTLTAEKVASGLLDDAKFELRLINYEDISMGSVFISAGEIGEVKISNGVVLIPELLDYAMRLRQTIGHFTSRTCRATFGKLPASSMTGCGVDVNPLWVQGSVSAVSSEEPYRIFYDENKPLEPFPTTARLQWLTGPNAGARLFQIEAYDNGTLALIEPTIFKIEVSHEYRIRPDCEKTETACKFYSNWVNYKGESLIPAEGSVGSTPGASTAKTFGEKAEAKNQLLFASTVLEIINAKSFKYSYVTSDVTGRKFVKIKWTSGLNVDNYSVIASQNFLNSSLTIKTTTLKPISVNDTFFFILESANPSDFIPGG